MAAPLQSPQAPAAEFSESRRDNSLAKLAALHIEAEETAHLANLLGRSAGIAVAIAGGAASAALLLSSISNTATLVWLFLSLAGVAALLVAYARTIRAPFERAALLSFREDLKAVLLYAGFAWGAGAWLILPYEIGAAAAVAFAALPVGAIATLSRDRDCAFLFGVPVTALVSFASVLRPFSDAGLDAGLILIACGAVGVAVLGAPSLRRGVTSLPFFNEIKA
jgi:hypothetical protein